MRQYFIEQMAMYSAYHRDFRNRLTHFVGVPAIAFALLVPMAWGGLGEVGGYTISIATLFAAAGSWALGWRSGRRAISRRIPIAGRRQPPATGEATQNCRCWRL